MFFDLLNDNVDGAHVIYCEGIVGRRQGGFAFFNAQGLVLFHLGQDLRVLVWVPDENLSDFLEEAAEVLHESGHEVRIAMTDWPLSDGPPPATEKLREVELEPLH